MLHTIKFNLSSTILVLKVITFSLGDIPVLLYIITKHYVCFFSRGSYINSSSMYLCLILVSKLNFRSLALISNSSCTTYRCEANAQRRGNIFFWDDFSIAIHFLCKQLYLALDTVLGNNKCSRLLLNQGQTKVHCRFAS